VGEMFGVYLKAIEEGLGGLGRRGPLRPTPRGGARPPRRSWGHLGALLSRASSSCPCGSSCPTATAYPSRAPHQMASRCTRSMPWAAASSAALA